MFFLPACFLVIDVSLVLVSLLLFLVAVISLPPCFCMLSSSRCPHCLQCWQVLFLPPFLTYCLLTSSLGCNALCMVISFLVLWSICLCSSLVHFKNGPEYLTRGQPRYLSLWQGSCNRFLSRVVFWLFWDSFLKIFISFLVVWWCQLPISPSICGFPFLWAFWWLFDLVVRLLPLCIVCHFSLLARGAFFYSKFHSYILTEYSYSLY